MTQHLLEAIEINKARAPRYAKLSGGKSRKISYALIAGEGLSLITSNIMDRKAKYWQNGGVPFMVHEFVPMSETPDFKESFDDEEGITSVLPSIDTKGIQKKMNELHKSKDYVALADYTTQVIADISKYPKHHCMIRHIFESILRSANLTPMHIEKSKEKGLKSPEGNCRFLLGSQINIIHISSLYDKWAHPLQKDGIPIIYQDVPYISPMPESY